MNLHLDNIIWRNVDDETLFLDTSTGYYFSLNQTGSEIWKMLSEGSSVETAAAQLSAKYDLPLESAHCDVNELIETLRSEKIIA